MKLEPSDRIVRAWALFLAVQCAPASGSTEFIQGIAKEFEKFINGGEE